jgi:TRAP-type C4-dicarboxylate transport system permease small subunit
MSESESKFEHVLKLINRVMAFLAALAIIFMMLAISYSVVLRYVWDKPVAWVVEISSYLMLYITFLGTGWLLMQDGHVEVDLFLANATPRTRAVFKAITFVGGAAVGFILTWKGALVTIDYFQRNVTVMGILDTPQYLLIGIIPIGGFLLLLGFILKIYKFIRVALGGTFQTQ